MFLLVNKQTLKHCRGYEEKTQPSHTWRYSAGIDVKTSRKDFLCCHWLVSVGINLFNTSLPRLSAFSYEIPPKVKYSVKSNNWSISNLNCSNRLEQSNRVKCLPLKVGNADFILSPTNSAKDFKFHINDITIYSNPVHIVVPQYSNPVEKRLIFLYFQRSV